MLEYRLQTSTASGWQAQSRLGAAHIVHCGLTTAQVLSSEGETRRSDLTDFQNKKALRTRMLVASGDPQPGSCEA